MSAEERIQRQHIHVVDSYVFSNHPIHFAGMAMFIATGDYTDRSSTPNPPQDGDNPNIQLRIEESEDGSTYTPVLISVSGGAPQLLLNMVSLSLAAILFTSPAPYVRVRLTTRNEVGVFIDCVQFPPKPREAPTEY